MTGSCDHSIRSCDLFPLQLVVMESRCRGLVNTKEQLEEKVTELERDKKANDKKLQQVGLLLMR